MLGTLFDVDLQETVDTQVVPQFIRAYMSHESEDVVEQCLQLQAKTADADQGDDWELDHELGELLDDILQHDADNSSEVTHMRQVVRGRMRRTLARARNKLRQLTVREKHRRAAAKRQARAKAKRRARPLPDTPRPEAGALPTPPPPVEGAPATPPSVILGAALGPPSTAPAAPAAPVLGIPALLADDVPLAALAAPPPLPPAAVAPVAPPPPLDGDEPPRDPRQPRGDHWGHRSWRVFKVYNEGAHCGWGATCACHTEGPHDTATCKKQILIGNRRNSDQCRTLCKNWLILGWMMERQPPNRKAHVEIDMRDPRNATMSEEECDAWVAITDFGP